MTPGCSDLCIPDDVKARVSPLKWVARDDWCPGCQWLEPSWWPGAKPDNAAPLVPHVLGLGAGPDLLMLAMWTPDKDVLVGMFDAAGDPVLGAVAAGSGSQGCGITGFSLGQDGKTAGVAYEEPHLSCILRPVERASELMLATQPDYIYDDAFVGKDSPGRRFFTADWIVDRFSGFASLVDVKSKTAVKIQDLPGAPPGEYDFAVISGNAVFVQAFTDKSAWFVVVDGVAKPFLGGADVDIDRLATDGKWIVWNEGTQLAADPVDPSRKIAQRYDLYRSPFTTDASKIQRQLLVPETHQFSGISTFANGYFTDIVLSRPDASAGTHSQAFVVQVDTGRAWTSDLPQNYLWGGQSYPTATELWGAVADRYDSAYAYTVARVPYADMQQIQSALP